MFIHDNKYNNKRLIILWLLFDDGLQQVFSMYVIVLESISVISNLKEITGKDVFQLFKNFLVMVAIKFILSKLSNGSLFYSNNHSVAYDPNVSRFVEIMECGCFRKGPERPPIFYISHCVWLKNVNKSLIILRLRCAWWGSAGFLNVYDCVWVLFGDFQPEEDNRKGLQFSIFLTVYDWELLIKD